MKSLAGLLLLSDEQAAEDSAADGEETGDRIHPGVGNLDAQFCWILKILHLWVLGAVL